MAIMAKSMGEVTYKDISSLHKWALVILISMGSSIIYAPMYLKNVFYDPLMQALGCTNADLGMMVSAYGLAAMICYLPSGIIADKFRMRTLATAGFLATAVLVFIYATLPSVGVCLALFVAMGVTSILVWWGTRFKVVRLCCEEEEYASKIVIIRIKALVGKAFSFNEEKKTTTRFEIGNYLFDSLAQTLTHAGLKQELSHRESEILKRLCENQNQVVNTQNVLLDLWGDDNFFNSRSLHVFITKLRHKLSADERIRIVNVRGIGYKLILN